IIAQARAQLPANSPLLNVVNSVASAAGTNNADLPGGKYENAFDPPSLNDTANAFANATLQRNAQTPGGAFMLFGPNNEGFALDLSNQANFELFAPLGAVGASITQFQRLIGNQFFAQMDFTVCTAGLSAVAGPYGAVSFVVSRA